MSKASFDDGTNQRSVRVAIYALVLLIIFSATALARGKQPALPPAAPLQAATIQPTKSPTAASKTRVFSPTPSPTSFVPRTPRKLSPDPYTVALYHFDNQIGQLVPDSGSTGQYTGTLYGTAFITPTGLFGGALQTDGNGSYVRIGSLPDMPQGTVEAFVDFRNACYGAVGGNFTIFAAGGEYGSNQPVLHFGISSDPYPQVSAEAFLHLKIITPDGRTARAVSGINPCRYLDGSPQGMNFGIFGLPVVWPYETWRFHHVAGTWGPRGLEIWVDGVLHGVGLYDTGESDEYREPYTCSPQQQVDITVSPNYPICGHPQTGLISGSYAGGLARSRYSTFLIGCDSRGSCFNGRIDEAQISNVQRTFQCLGPVGPFGPSQCVDPTSTPTPTQTPDRISGEYSVDAHTLALYHLNSLVSGGVQDAVSGSISYQNGNGVITPNGRYSGALSLDGNDSFFTTCNSCNSWNPPQGAAEAWVNLTNPNGNFEVISAGDGWASKLHLGTLAYYSGNVRFGVEGNWADSHIQPTALVGNWHHLAGTWGSRGLEIWIDGSLCGTNPAYTEKMSHPVDDFQVACKTGSGIGNCMQGAVDEVRISDVQRSYSPLGLGLSPLRLRPLSNITSARTPAWSAPSVFTLTYYFPFVASAPMQSIQPLIQCPMQ